MDTPLERMLSARELVDVSTERSVRAGAGDGVDGAGVAGSFFELDPNIAINVIN